MAPVAVGLTNQGATGYLNVGLQVLYHIPALRDAVLSLPLDEHSDPTRCPPLAWQRLFSRMRSGLRCAQPISTKEITQSMGWEGQHLNLAQEAHGMLLALLMMLQHTCHITKQHDIVEELFGGAVTEISSFRLLDHKQAAAPAADQDAQLATQQVHYHQHDGSSSSSSGLPAVAPNTRAPRLLMPLYSVVEQPFLTLVLPTYDQQTQQVANNITAGLGLYIKSSVYKTRLEYLPTSLEHERPQGVPAEVDTTLQQQQQQQPETVMVVHNEHCPQHVLVMTSALISKPPPVLVLPLSRHKYSTTHNNFIYLKHAVSFPEFLDLRWCCAGSSSSSSNGVSSLSAAVGTAPYNATGSQAVQLMCREVAGQQHVPADRSYCLVSVVSLMSLPRKTLRRYCVFVRAPTKAPSSAQQQKHKQQKRSGPRLQYSPGSSSWIRLYNEQVHLVPPEEALHQQYGLQSAMQSEDVAAAGGLDGSSSGDEADSIANLLLYVRMDQWERVMNSSSSSSSNSSPRQRSSEKTPKHTTHKQQQSTRQQQQAQVHMSSHYEQLYHTGFYSSGDLTAALCDHFINLMG